MIAVVVGNRQIDENTTIIIIIIDRDYFDYAGDTLTPSPPVVVVAVIIVISCKYFNNSPHPLIHQTAYVCMYVCMHVVTGVAVDGVVRDNNTKAKQHLQSIINRTCAFLGYYTYAACYKTIKNNRGVYWKRQERHGMLSL